MNCWEKMECGRVPGGIHEKDLGICPAYLDTDMDGTNSGRNAGRICWYIAGTFCGGELQGTFADKQSTCLMCKHYQDVQKEEDNFRMMP